MTIPQAVIDQHLKCFSDHDLDGVLADYAPDAVFFIPGQPLQGRDAIEPFFKALLAEFAKPGATFSLQQQSFAGDYGYILWNAETAEHFYEAATDTFVVQNGKIVAQSFAAKITPKH